MWTRTKSCRSTLVAHCTRRHWALCCPSPTLSFTLCSPANCPLPRLQTTTAQTIFKKPLGQRWCLLYRQRWPVLSLCAELFEKSDTVYVFWFRLSVNRSFMAHTTNISSCLPTHRRTRRCARRCWVLFSAGGVFEMLEKALASSTSGVGVLSHAAGLWLRARMCQRTPMPPA